MAAKLGTSSGVAPDPAGGAAVARPVAVATPSPQPIPPPAPPARAQLRHVGVLASFLLIVLLPSAAAAWYLWTKAADQYASTVAFSVRAEETSSAIELLGGITELSGSSSSDADILYEFIQSQRLVAEIDTALDLRGLWSWPEGDPFFTYAAEGTIEDLVEYWERMVKISHDTTTGLIEVRVLAFRPEDATRVAEAIFQRSSEMINTLSAIAREDAIRYAREELDEAIQRLKSARQAVTAFRNQYQIVNPEADLQIQVELLATLQTKLAEALIEQELLAETTRPGDTRMAQVERRIRVIRDQIAAERRKVGVGASGLGEEAFADIIGEYESLSVDREFAERAYTGALANYDAAQAEARRKSRYLAAHVEPTHAESARYPERPILLLLTALFLFLVWGIGVLVFYSLRDRR